MKTKKFIWALFSLALFACDSDDDATPLGTIDLEATSITFSVVKDAPFTGVATITGTITNIGTADYESGEEQQLLLLYERQLGATSPGTLVSQLAFKDLAVGASVQVTFTRNWYTASPAEGEFPPDYILIISYDPDIFLESNPNNDDSNSSNNRIEESGSAINTLF